MAKTNKKFYVTTSIPYANAGPHIGHILDPLAADVLARYERIKGKEVKFLAGTDEHGAKIARTAKARNITPRELVDENSAKFKALHKTLNLSRDDFIRTTDKKRHWPAAQKMWRELIKSGDIYWKKYRGLYCVGHEAFVTEKDLINGKCRDHQREPEVVEEENWFFRLSKYSKKIKAAIISGRFKIIPESRQNEILSLIKSGLDDVSFSRPAKDLAWGIPVPGDPTQTMYVWCDALVNYISAIGYGEKSKEGQKSFKKWWPADLQIIGKDNLRFHAAIWPGMLFSAGLALPKRLFVHGFINVKGDKISKTVGNVIAPEELTKKYGVDPVRYHFLREFPYSDDGDFTYEKFEQRYNADLANGLGNFVSRVLTLAQKARLRQGFGGRGKIMPRQNKNFAAAVKETEKNIEKSIGELKFSEALGAIWRLVALGDKYVDNKKPWTLPVHSTEFKEVIGSLLFLISEIGKLLFPFLPETSGKIEKLINPSTKLRARNKKSGVLFPRLK
ncbi:MAG: methionine--tRNA ligase [bacterium]|nr:methionine--tRNA ligase [bacterium]